MEHDNVISYLHSVFNGWMQYDSMAGHYAVYKEGLLFMVMTLNQENYARVTLCKVQEPNRQLAHDILSSVTEYCIAHFGGWAWVYPHEDRPYSQELLESVDLCCGGSKDLPMHDVHLYNASKPLQMVLHEIVLKNK